MRIEYHEDVDECRDAIDQGWYDFLDKCGLYPFLIPNIKNQDFSFIKKNLKGVILSGGDDLGKIPERDLVENLIFRYCISQKIPLLGVCRGMQLAGVFYGGELRGVQNHVLSSHEIDWSGQKRVVNSYHRYGFTEVPACFEVLARSKDGIIESIRHKTAPFIGIMWHPERERRSDHLDTELFKSHFS